jgi:hypothetical protein
LRIVGRKLIYPDMNTENPRKPAGTGRYSRWPTLRRPPSSPNRLAFRLLAIPALAVAGVLIWRGAQDRLTLPDCDSSRAKSTLDDVLKQLKVEPLRDEPVRQISSSREQVACSVVLPLSEGATLSIDYTFFWRGSAVQMKYSISRRPGKGTAGERPTVPSSP